MLPLNGLSMTASEVARTSALFVLLRKRQHPISARIRRIWNLRLFKRGHLPLRLGRVRHRQTQQVCHLTVRGRPR